MLVYVFVLLAVVVRFIPHPLAFTPVAASLLYFGARAPKRQAWLPLALLFGSDIILTKMVYGYPFTLDHVATWAWYAAVLWMGGFLRQDSRPLRIAGASLTASVSFFLISNFSVWAVWNMYPKTVNGLATAYLAGVPFFRNELASDLFFTAVMFGIGALVSDHTSEEARNHAV